MGQCILLQADTLPCVSLSWKCRSLPYASTGCWVHARTQRDKIGALHRRFYMHACLTLSHCLRHTMHTFASDVMARNWSHAVYSIIEVACTLSVSPCPSHDNLAISRQSRAWNRTRRPFYAHAYTLCPNNACEKPNRTMERDNR